MLTGAMLATGPMPVPLPVSGTVWGLPAASSVTLMLALWAPRGIMGDAEAGALGPRGCWLELQSDVAISARRQGRLGAAIGANRRHRQNEVTCVGTSQCNACERQRASPRVAQLHVRHGAGAAHRHTAEGQAGGVKYDGGSGEMEDRGAPNSVEIRDHKEVSGTSLGGEG